MHHYSDLTSLASLALLLPFFLSFIVSSTGPLPHWLSVNHSQLICPARSPSLPSFAQWNGKRTAPPNQSQSFAPTNSSSSSQPSPPHCLPLQLPADSPPPPDQPSSVSPEFLDGLRLQQLPPSQDEPVHLPDPLTGTGSPNDPLIKLSSRTNYASFDCSASIHRASKTCRSPSSILNEKKDKYMLIPCQNQNNFIVFELCDEIEIDHVLLANFEFFSSMFKLIRISVSGRSAISNDPHHSGTPNSRNEWVNVGLFRTRNMRGVQVFAIKNLKGFYRYVRLDFLSHYGSEYYCPLSLVRIYGLTQIDAYRRDQELEQEDRQLSSAHHLLQDSASLDHSSSSLPLQNHSRPNNHSSNIPSHPPPDLLATETSSLDHTFITFQPQQTPPNHPTTTTSQARSSFKDPQSHHAPHSSSNLFQTVNPEKLECPAASQLEQHFPMAAPSTPSLATTKPEGLLTIPENVVLTSSPPPPHHQPVIDDQSLSSGDASSSSVSREPVVPPQDGGPGSSAPEKEDAHQAAPPPPTVNKPSPASPPLSTPPLVTTDDPGRKSGPGPNNIRPGEKNSIGQVNSQATESIFGQIMKRLTALESNSDLLLRYVEEQVRVLESWILRLDQSVVDLSSSIIRQETKYKEDLNFFKFKSENERSRMARQIQSLNDSMIYIELLVAIQSLCLIAILLFLSITRFHHRHPLDQYQNQKNSKHLSTTTLSSNHHLRSSRWGGGGAKTPVAVTRPSPLRPRSPALVRTRHPHQQQKSATELPPTRRPIKPIRKPRSFDLHLAAPKKSVPSSLEGGLVPPRKHERTESGTSSSVLDWATECSSSSSIEERGEFVDKNPGRLDDDDRRGRLESVEMGRVVIDTSASAEAGGEGEALGLPKLSSLPPSYRTATVNLCSMKSTRTSSPSTDHYKYSDNALLVAGTLQDNGALMKQLFTTRSETLSTSTESNSTLIDN